ncbi:hypothetical protein IWQ61_007209 [Dispira simplex]|nr:hypothetical protein IWQ61_007209 [Dispira simplex]
MALIFYLTALPSLLKWKLPHGIPTPVPVRVKDMVISLGKVKEKATSLGKIKVKEKATSLGKVKVKEKATSLGKVKVKEKATSLGKHQLGSGGDFSDKSESSGADARDNKEFTKVEDEALLAWLHEKYAWGDGLDPYLYNGASHDGEAPKENNQADAAALNKRGLGSSFCFSLL